MPTPKKVTAPAQQPARAPRGYTPEEALAVAVKRARREEITAPAVDAETAAK